MGYAEKNLAPGESVLHRARYHWVAYGRGLGFLALAVLLAAASFYASRVSPESGVSRPVAYLAGFFLLLSVVALLARCLRTVADEFVVTTRRVIRRVGLLSREVEQAPVEKIQDITVEQGWLGRLLDFGTVTLETASERGTLTFPSIAHPEAFRNALWGQAAPAAGALTQATAPAGAVSSSRQRLAELENLRQQGLVSDQEYAAKRLEILTSV